jgi:hypothetical protein
MSDMPNSQFLRIVGRQTFSESGVRRFAVRFGLRCNEHALGVGVTAHSPAEAVASRPFGWGTVRNATDSKTALMAVGPAHRFLNGEFFPAPRPPPSPSIPYARSARRPAG